MIDDLKPYPAMKDSGVPWLGELPAGWEVRRNGRLFVQRNETGFPDLPILRGLAENRRPRARLRELGEETGDGRSRKVQARCKRRHRVQHDADVAGRRGVVAHRRLGQSGVRSCAAPSGNRLWLLRIPLPNRQLHGRNRQLLARDREATAIVSTGNSSSRSRRRTLRPANKPPSSASSTTRTGGSGATSAPSRS